MRSIRHPRATAKLVLALAGLAMFASGCGGGPKTAEQTAAIDAGEANEALLELSSQMATTELLDATTGEITTLSDVADGDRPVLVWYWAPH